jgi:hypothetical protein
MKKLLAAAELFSVKHVFTPGQVVEWKPNMKHKRTEGPFVVVDVIDPPVFDQDNNCGTPYFREPLDVVLGALDNDGDFLTYHFDSRRFQPVAE